MTEPRKADRPVKPPAAWWRWFAYAVAIVTAVGAISFLGALVADLPELLRLFQQVRDSPS